MKRLLDLFSGAGGATRGYQLAGFHVTGVDIKPQPRYCGDAFFQSDALEFLRIAGETYDVIHASPPCQDYSAMRRATQTRHERLIDDMRTELLKLGKPYIIENVEGADLKNPLLLCGTMFSLRVRRHRLFETSPAIYFPPAACDCRNGVRDGRLVGQMLSGKVAPGRTPRHGYTEADRREAIGVPWMTTMEARQAIPPEYTRFIGEQLLETLSYAEAAS